jgi:hypothetical protein
MTNDDRSNDDRTGDGQVPNWGDPRQEPVADAPRYGERTEPAPAEAPRYGSTEYAEQQGRYGRPDDPQPQYGQQQYGQTQDLAQHGQQGYGDDVPAAPRNGLGIAALIFGVLAILSAWVPVLGVVGILLAILAIVLGFSGRGRAKRGRATNGGVALGGAVLGILALIIGLIIQVLVFVAGFTFLNSGGRQAVEQFQQCVQQQVTGGATPQQAQTTCRPQLVGPLQRVFGGGGQGG